MCPQTQNAVNAPWSNVAIVPPGEFSYHIKNASPWKLPWNSDINVLKMKVRRAAVA